MSFSFLTRSFVHSHTPRFRFDGVAASFCTVIFAAGALTMASLRADEVTGKLDGALAAYNEKHLIDSAAGFDSAALLIRRQLGEQLATYLPQDAFDSKAFPRIEDGAVYVEKNFVVEERNVVAGKEGKKYFYRLGAGRGKIAEDYAMLLAKKRDPKFKQAKPGDRFLMINGYPAWSRDMALAREVVVYPDSHVMLLVSRGTEAELIARAEAIDYKKILAEVLPTMDVRRGAAVMDANALMVEAIGKSNWEGVYGFAESLKTPLDGMEPAGDVALKTAASAKAYGAPAPNRMLAAEIADDAAFQTRRTWPGILAKWLPPVPKDGEASEITAMGFTEKPEWSPDSKKAEHATGGPLVVERHDVITPDAEDAPTLRVDVKFFAGGYPVLLFKVLYKQIQQTTAADGANNPSIAYSLMMLGNPNIIQVKGRDAVLYFDSNNNKGRIEMLATDSIILSVASESSGITPEFLRSYAESVDYEALEKAL